MEPGGLALTLERGYGRISEIADGLTGPDLGRPTRCAGMPVGALLVHLLSDAERALIAFATPVDDEPDRDFVSYWRDFPAGSAGEARFERAVAAAYSGPDSLARHWRDLSSAAVRAAGAALGGRKPGQVGTQGHVLAVKDFVATLVFEATVHHLDLVLDLPDAPGPDPEGLQVVARTLDGLFGLEAWDVIQWDTITYVLKGTGRVPLSAEDLDTLGPYAERLPLIG